MTRNRMSIWWWTFFGGHRQQTNCMKRDGNNVLIDVDLFTVHRLLLWLLLLFTATHSPTLRVIVTSINQSITQSAHG